MTKPMPATVHYGDAVEQRVDLTFGPERLSIVGVPERNHPTPLRP